MLLQRDTESHIQSHIDPFLKKLNIWLKDRNLKLSAEKSIATIFTTWSKEVKFDPKLEIDGMPIPTKTKSKILGVTLDSMLTVDAPKKHYDYLQSHW